jgi:hypothetical protein
MSSFVSRLLSKASSRVLVPFSDRYSLQFVLFAAVGAVLVVSTTAVVGHEWTKPQERAPAPEWLRDDMAGFEIIEDDMDEKDDEDTDGAENSNVLHLLYTIAQVISCP